LLRLFAILLGLVLLDIGIVEVEIIGAQFPNRRFVFWLPSDKSPICTGNLPFSLAFQLTLRLSSAISLRLCLPTQLPTLADRQILRLAFRSTSNLRWRPTFRPAFPASL